jgi:hypothetical protein
MRWCDKAIKEYVERWKREEAEKEKDSTPIAPSTEQSRPTTAKRSNIMSILNDEPAEPPPPPKPEDIREELLQQDAQDRRRREREAARRRTDQRHGYPRSFPPQSDLGRAD